MPRKKILPPVFFHCLAGLVFCLILPLAAGGAEKETAEAGLPSRWTPQEAVLFALRNNPDTAIARQRIAAARATLQEASAAFYPRISFSASYSRTDNPMYSFGNILNQGMFSDSIDFNDPGTTDNLSVSSTVNYRLYNGGGDRAAVRAATALKDASRYEQAAVESALAFEVVSTFYTIVQARDMVQARLSAVDSLSASVGVARARYEAGDLLKADLLSLEVQQSRARENLIQARHALDLAGRALLNLLGLEQGPVDVQAESAAGQEVPADLSFDSRPELLALTEQIKAAEAGVRRARSGHYPSADAWAGYQVDQGYALDGSGNSWIAGIKVNFDLFAGHRTSARVARAMAGLAESREQKHKMSLAMNLEVDKARLALQQAEERIQVTEKMVEQARESAHLSRERFKEGVILSSELIDVENRLTDALFRRTVAQSARRIAVADLRRAVGLPQFARAESP